MNNQVSSEDVLNRCQKLIDSIKNAAIDHFSSTDTLKVDDDLVLITALTSVLTETLALSLALKTDFMPTEQETNLFIKDVNTYISEGIKSYLVEEQKLKDVVDCMLGSEHSN